MQEGCSQRRGRVRAQSLMPAGEAAPAVRCAALRCLVRVLAAVDALPPSDSNLFTEYILPSLSLLPADGEEAVRVEYAGRHRAAGRRRAPLPAAPAARRRRAGGRRRVALAAGGHSGAALYRHFPF